MALRDHPRIPDQTRERIRAIASRLGYRVDPLVAALMQSRRRSRVLRHTTLAYVTSHPTRFEWQLPASEEQDEFRAARFCARQLGYSLEQFCFTAPKMTPARLLSVLETRSIRGLLIGPLPATCGAPDLPWDRFTSVAIGSNTNLPAVHRVTEDYFDTCGQALDRCMERGYRRVGLVFSSDTDCSLTTEHQRGALFLRQLKLRTADRVPPCPGVPTNSATFAKWLRRERPDALVVTHAAPVREWLATLGVAVPIHLGLVELRSPSGAETCAIFTDPKAVASRATELLVGLLHRNQTGAPPCHHEEVIAARWHEGTTLPKRQARTRGRSYPGATRDTTLASV